MDLAAIQDWAKERRERTTASDHVSAIDALAMTLDGSESPIAVAAMITKSYGSYVEQPLKNSDGNRVYPFWVTLCDAARTFGSAQGRLIDLLHAILMQPDTNATDGSSLTDPTGSIYWRASRDYHSPCVMNFCVRFFPPSHTCTR
jgi:hypothetical protein